MSFSIFVATQNWAATSGLKANAAPVISSTNDWAKERALAPETEDLEVYLADHQTQGRGRNDRTWSDGPTGSCLLSTWSFKVNEMPQPVLAPAFGLALYRACVATWPDLQFSLKAPNDLYLGDKKVAGLLLESISQGPRRRLLLGVGLNVFAKPADADPEMRAGALTDFMKIERVNEMDWNLFLDRYWLENIAVLRETRNGLTPNQRASLAKALNAHGGSTPVREVDADGTLHRIDGTTVQWSQL